jgi:hypothetical protein
MPITSHPNAASLSTSPIAVKLPCFKTAVAIASTTGGLKIASGIDQNLEPSRTKDSGVARSPTRRDREKLRVARVERNMPNSKREND